MRREPSVRARLVVLVLSVFVPAAVVAGSGALYTWWADRRADERELVSQAGVLAAAVARELELSKATLQALATSPALEAGDLEAFHRQLLRAPKPEGARFVLADAAGRMRLNSLFPPGAALPKRGDLGVVERVFATGLPQVSDLYVGPMTREFLVAVDVPVELGGRVAYDLGMVFAPAVLARVIERAVPAGGSAFATVLDGKGAIVARSAGMEAYIGRPAAAASLAAVARGEGLFASTSQEGHPVLAANARVPGTGWSAVVATRRDLAEADLLRSLAAAVAAGAGVLLLGLLVAAHHARRIARPLHALVGAADALAHGGPPPPAPPGVREASRVGAALARAADALRARGQERDRAEAARRAGEARLARLLALVPAGIVELDAGGRFAYANPAAERVLGAGPGGLVGRHYGDSAWHATAQDGEPIPPDRLPGAWALRGQAVSDYEHAITALDGRRVALLVDVVPVRDAAGRVEGALAAFQDVTARHEAARALREAELRFRQLVGNIEQVFWILDPRARRLLYVSPAYERLWGRPPDAVRASLDAWFEAVHPEDRDRVRAAVLDDPGGPFDLEYRAVRPDGTLRRVRDRGWPVRDEAGGGACLTVGIAEDVTGRKRAEEALRESEAKFRTITDAMPQMVWSARPDGHHDYFNRRWYEYTGLRPGEADGEGWRASFHPDDLARAVPAWRRSLATGEPYEVEYRLRRADGAWRWCLGRALPVRDGDAGRILRWFGTCTDVQELVDAREAMARGREELEARVAERTAELRHALGQLHEEVLERERAEDALRQAQKMEAVGQLTGGIAHDFNNMLQGIGGAVELVQRRLAQGRAAEAVPFIEAARRGIARAAALTHRLLAFARRQALDPRPVVPGELVRGMAELIRRTVGPGVEVELRLDDGAGAVLCDANQLENALLNLAINARDAMSGEPLGSTSGEPLGSTPGGGRLTVATRRVRLGAADLAGADGAGPGEYVEIAVSDTGAGMDEATRARAFEPFFTTKPIGQGTGLGLSQLYGFVRQSGGFVRLDSAPGWGTTVRLYLPRHEPAPAPAERAGPGAEPGRADAGETVLLVDDEAGVREVVAERLRELGYAVLEAGDGPAALRLLGAGARADLLVTDVGLPGGMNGRQVAEAARERRPGLPVLFITGHAGAALDERLAPGTGVIGKPFTLDDLAARVRAMLEAVPAAPPG